MPIGNNTSGHLYDTTFTTNGPLYSAASGVMTSSSAGTAGAVYQAGTPPAFSTATYPSTATGTGKILIANGTNWVASTPTFPNSAGSSGNVLVSDGTNFVSSTPTPIFKQVTRTLTSLEIKNLHATPIEIIPAPGSGKTIVITTLAFYFIYGGNNVFVAGSGQTINLYFNNTTTFVTASTPVTNAMIVSSTSRVTAFNPSLSGNINVALGVVDNVNIAAWQGTSVTEISGNANNDNTIDIVLTYYVLTL